jgi:N-sulfoglucosamine sulfohydrolase
MSLNRLLVIFVFGLSIQGMALCADTAKPNILFLLSDDHSYPYLSCYGNKDVQTPTLDRLADEGMRLDRMFVACPQCVPSRATLMTGRSPVSVRMVRFTSPLPNDVVALPDILRDRAGYYTGVGGRSYHLDGPGAEGKNPAPELSRVMEEHHLRTFKRRVDYVEKGAAKDSGGRLSDFLDSTPANKPWFFWLGFSDPHHPWTAKGKRGTIDPASVHLPAHLPDLPGVRRDFARYLDEIQHLDEDVQLVLDKLRDRGFADNTLVVFMGDNGMAMPHGKGSLHDPGIHVPLLVRWPNVVKPGSTSLALISGEDFAPTMLEAAGVKPPREMSGLSFLKLLRNEPFEPRKFVFAERGPHGGDGAMKPGISAATFDLARCVRSDRFKLIYNCTPHGAVAPVDSQGEASWQEMKAANIHGKLDSQFNRAYFTSPRPTFELYDLDADPGEMNNLAGDARYEKQEYELKRQLTEKMVLDWDFLPTPLR